MVADTRSRSWANRQSNAHKKSMLQPNQQRSPLHEGDEDQERIVALDAQIAILTQQNANLLCQIPEQSHSEGNWDVHMEEEGKQSNHSNDHGCQEDGHHDDNS